MQDIRKRYNITNSNAASARAAMVFQALKHNVAQCVSVRLTGGLDTHGPEWATSQPERLHSAFQALNSLVNDLKREPHPNGGKYIDHTTIVAFSEFSRTPLINPRDGRDHYISSSCMLIGAGIPHNKVIGATSNQGMDPMAVNPITGKTEVGGRMVTPGAIFASLLKGTGYDVRKLRAEELPCLIKS